MLRLDRHEKNNYGNPKYSIAMMKFFTIALYLRKGIFTGLNLFTA